MSKLRILVLSSSTGGGHDARAEAFAEWCFHLYRHKVDVRIEQMLEKSSVVNRLGVNFYISRTPTACDYAVKKGIPPVKSLVRGHLMHPRSYVEILTTPDDRAEFRVKKLELEPDLFTVFLTTGSNGANNHLDLLPALVRHAGRCQAIVVCGRNHETYN